MNEDVLEQIYQEGLEERIISYIAETMEISLEEAMKAYYSSRLANKIHNGRYGVQYLDYKVLVQILYETEPELFEKKESDALIAGRVNTPFSHCKLAWETGF